MAMFITLIGGVGTRLQVAYRNSYITSNQSIEDSYAMLNTNMILNFQNGHRKQL